MKHVLSYVLFGVLSFSSVQAESLQQSYIASLRKSFTPIGRKTITLAPVRFVRGQGISYSRIQRHYEADLTKCLPREFTRDLRKTVSSVLTPYSGTLDLTSAETLSSPCLLITVEGQDPASVAIERFDTEFQGRTIPVLRASTRMKQVYSRLPVSDLDHYYVPDISAHAAGFLYGQLILDLSQNVETAKAFDYNGVRPWSEHNALKENDQIEHPIQLSNFSHSMGSLYVISAHPDFALTTKKYRTEKAVLSFFLWRDEPMAGALPDLLYQLVLLPSADSD